ncbi:MAG: class I SAM-dependent methyltransferase [archaeon]|nr:class I SAM-dependent methyltransferase [archaeon]MCP8317230.1 class I SAM-dependent methyltransferase [archaeon]
MAKIYPSPIPRQLLGILDIPVRDFILSREELLKRSGLKSGQNVLEAGCGTGFYTIKASEIVKEGIVNSLDIQDLALAKVRKKVEENNVKNVMLIMADAQNLPFKDEAFDIAFLVTVIGEIPKREIALKELHRVLKSNGLLSITEFLADPHYVMRRNLISLAERFGFNPAEKYGNFFCYTINFKKEI